MLMSKDSLTRLAETALENASKAGDEAESLAALNLVDDLRVFREEFREMGSRVLHNYEVMVEDALQRTQDVREVGRELRTSLEVARTHGHQLEQLQRELSMLLNRAQERRSDRVFLSAIGFAMGVALTLLALAAWPYLTPLWRRVVAWLPGLG